jgi:hypothetical protein
MYVCEPCVCPVPTEVRRGHRNWGSRRLWAGCRCWESNPGPGENSVLHHEASCQPAPHPTPHWFLFILTFSEERQNELFDPESWSLLWTLEHSSLSVLNVSIISGVHISLQPITISTSQGRSTALLADIFASFISFCFFFWTGLLCIIALVLTQYTRLALNAAPSFDCSFSVTGPL